MSVDLAALREICSVSRSNPPVTAFEVLALVEAVEAALNLLTDVDEAQADDLRLHDLQQRIGALFLGYGGGWNHDDDLRAALAPFRQEPDGRP